MRSKNRIEWCSLNTLKIYSDKKIKKKIIIKKAKLFIY